MSAQEPPPANPANASSSPVPLRPRSLALAGAASEPQPQAAPRLWRSLEERDGADPAAPRAAQEFPAGASVLEGVSRRDFVGLLSGTLALSGAACYRPTQKIVPYVRRPPEVTPGNPLHFASAYALEGYAVGLIVESHGGRPTKIEGNADHPDSLGTTGVYEQALTLSLYDDDRATAIRSPQGGLAWRQFLALTAQNVAKHVADGGAKLRFLLEPTGSPLTADLRARILQKLPKAKFVSFSPVAADGVVEGARLVYGKPLEPRHDLSQARVIVALDADFLSDGPEQLRLSRQFGAGREPGPNMSRLYVAEPCPTPTGTIADHRLRLRGSDVAALALALAARLGESGVQELAPFSRLPAQGGSVDARWVAALAKDLIANKGKSVVIAGRRQPAAVHALVNAINAALGNVGATVTYWAAKSPDALVGIEPLRALVEEIAAGQVETLVVTAENPVYSAPVDFKLGKLLERVPNVIYLGNSEDETAAVAGTLIPKAHVLESWGDGEALDGTVSIIQPLINPLWHARTEGELLAAFLGEGDKGAHAILKEAWMRRGVAEGRATADSFETVWETWLAKGVVDKTGGQAESAPALDGVAVAGRLGAVLGALPRGPGLEISFALDGKVYDGRFANNAWLQELPHATTKVTWDNAVILSKATAAELKVTTGDMVTVAVGATGDRQVTGPVYVQPGHADGAATLALGYGRSFGKIAKGVGFNAYLLRTSAAPWFEPGGSITKTNKRHRFGTTQVHWSMEGRDPVKVAPLAEVLDKESKFMHHLARERGVPPTIHTPVDYSKQPYKWGMSIDLGKCTGCSACVVACQAENNIPVVGRDNVRIGREMQWIRVDLYHEGSEDDPQLYSQPVMCVHCETAPCEYVCPVNATAHSDEGLNEMVYNRCIGTRYCSNNCPYKVRRFNFLDYRPATSPVEKMVNNPDVTVRSRGIMEKCTYCVQRIERARIDSRVEGRPIRDGEIQTACQQSCATGAIEFGSLNDPGSRVSARHADPRRYDLLYEIGTRPRTAYLARVRNPNPELG
jgi:MoCo/4Fe-4S cofactor protein with predicted Tat translocation signal